MGRELEVFPRCHATRRDLKSPQAEEPPVREFLLPNDARVLTHLQAQDPDEPHKNDFWHYWGAYQYWNEDVNFRRDHWKWKVELHYRDRVAVTEIDAILWPVEFRLVRSRTNGVERRSPDLAEIARFRKAHPGIWVIPYEWSERGFADLVRVSTGTALYFHAYHSYPEDGERAIAELPL
jgi:hypothetical protein